MRQVRTDLALEAKEIWRESTTATDEIPGVEATEEEINGFKVTRVKILDETGEKNLGKPKGTYITIETDGYIKREEDAFSRCATAVSDLVRDVLNLSPKDPVMVAGLGNEHITPDAIGPVAIRNTMVTRHLVQQLPDNFGFMREVSAVAPGVLAFTGIESVELIKSAAEKSGAKAVIAIDALASRKLSRVCRTIQIADTGIVPGSGVGNARSGIDKSTIGVPVIAIGVPTVVDAGTLVADLMAESGGGKVEPSDFGDFGGDMIVTPKEIDRYALDMAKVIGYGINMALHNDLTVEDIAMFID